MTHQDLHSMQSVHLETPPWADMDDAENGLFIDEDFDFDAFSDDASDDTNDLARLLGVSLIN